MLCGVGIPLPRQIEQMESRESVILGSRPPYCMGQMLNANARAFSPHILSLSKSSDPDIFWCARCVEQCETMLTTIRSVVPYLQFKMRAKPHLCMTNKSVQHRSEALSFTQVVLGKYIPIGLMLIVSMIT